jgi:hypothetical protein
VKDKKLQGPKQICRREKRERQKRKEMGKKKRGHDHRKPPFPSETKRKRNEDATIERAKGRLLLIPGIIRSPASRPAPSEITK